MSVRSFLHQASYHLQQKHFFPFRNKHLSFPSQRIRAFILNMDGRQGVDRGRGRGRVTPQWKSKGSFGGPGSPASALGGAKTDVEIPASSDNSRSEVGASDRVSAGAAGGISEVPHQCKSKGSFGGPGRPASVFGEAKTDVEIPASFDDSRSEVVGASDSVSAGAAGGISEVPHQCKGKGSFGGPGRPASALGEAKTDVASFNDSRSEVVGASDRVSAGAAGGISGTDGRNKSGFVNKEVRGRGIREENIASPSSLRRPAGRGGGGRGGRWNDGNLSQNDKIDALGRTLVRILRHQASQLGLGMTGDGFVNLKDLLRLQVRTSAGFPLASHTIEDVRQAVKENNKQRLGIIDKDGKSWIRANQGHSLKIIESEKLLRLVKTAVEIPVCIHGTYKRNLDSILREGLKRMGRIHVHFASGLPKDNGVISGMRSSCQVLIYLDVAKALNDNMKLFISENGVILTEGLNGVVSPAYFKKVESWPEGTLIKHLKA